MDNKQRTKEWFNDRKGRVTASNVGAILGVDPWRNREDVMRAMVRDYHGAETEFKGNPATFYGTNTEMQAKLCFTRQTGIDVEETGFARFAEWLGASPDGLTADGGVLEIKCPYGIRNDQDPAFKTLKEQPQYYAQVQIQMFACGSPFAHFAQYVPPFGDVFDADYREEILRHEVVKPDLEWLEENLSKLRAFYDEYLVELDNPVHLEPLRVELNDDESLKLLDHIGELDDAIYNATEARKAAIERLVALAGEKDALIHGRKLTRVERKGSVQYSKLLKDHPIEGVDTEQYRGKGSVSWRLS